VVIGGDIAYTHAEGYTDAANGQIIGGRA
jgi:hypothetical protein